MTPVITNRNVFDEALPYGVAALSMSAVGIVLNATATLKTLAIAGAILTMLGSFLFVAVLATGLLSKTCLEFRENINKGTAVALAFTIFSTLVQYPLRFAPIFI